MIAQRHLPKSLLVIAVLAFSLVACDSATGINPPPDVAPTLISSSAFTIDSDSFPNSVPAYANGTNHTRAFFTVALVNLAVGIHLVIPAAATAAATQVTPTVESGTWIWENTVSVNGQPITFRLEGTPSGSQVNWEMLISANNIGGVAYDDFSLYTATTSLDGTSSNWSLYYNIQGQRTRVLDADHLSTGAQRELTFTIPESNPNPDAHGVSVYYLAEGNERGFDYQEPTPGQNHLIEWDAATAAGAITAWDYNNGEKACWDNNLDNVPCEPTL